MNEKYVELYKKAKNVDDKYEILGHLYNDDDKDTILYLIDDLRKELSVNTKNRKAKLEDRNRWLGEYKESFKFTSHYRFEDYMYYLEMNRPYDEQFYRPRRRTLHTIAEKLQAIHDGELDELFISQPPRTGKSTIVTYYLTWIMGLNSEGTNLYSSCSDLNTNSFLKGVLEVMSDSATYNYRDIFPNFKIAGQDNKKNTVDLGRRKKYPTLTCRSIEGTLNGSCDCNSLLIADDLVKGIEDVLNPDRLYKLWKLVDNNLLTRAKETAKIIWIGTRWSINDPIGIRLEMLEEDDAYKSRRYDVVNLPALDDDDNSNFVYDFNLGFSTETFKQRRASFERADDIASWLAQYMGEPVEREGALFEAGSLNYFNGVLPDEKPIRITCSVDIAWGGGDYVSAPVAYIYDDGKVYIPDVVFNNSDKFVTRPKIANLLIRNNVGDADFELNNGGGEYRDGVERELDKAKYRCTLTGHSAPAQKAKDVRIFQNAPEIREFYFLETGKRSKEYSQFMMNLFSYKVVGRNKHDDAPDSLAQLADNVRGSIGNKVVIFKRPF